MAEPLLILLALLVLYVGFIFWLLRSGRMEKWDLSLMLGLVLMQRTQRGKGVIDAIARPRRFWNVVGDIGIVLTLGGMVAITLFFLWSVWLALQPNSGVPALGVKEIFVIPGINPFVPLWYGLAALAITLIVHEGGHGVLARANGMKLKSLGLLWLIVPIGAFVEPEELDLKVASRRNRLRVFGAGPAVNLAFATIALTCFAILMGSLVPNPGAWVGGVTQDAAGRDLPAKAAGIREADIVVSAGGNPIGNWTALQAFLNRAHPGDTVPIGLSDHRTLAVTLTSDWAVLSEGDRFNITAGNEPAMSYCRRVLNPPPQNGPDCAARLKQKARMGVVPRTADEFAFLGNPLAGCNVVARQFHGCGTGLLRLTSLPIAEVLAHEPVLAVYMPAFFATPFEHTTFWILANLLFWVFWINLMVGITNILPMLPLDGGHIFREALGGAVAKVRPNLPVERRERIVAVAATSMSFLILGAFILQIAAPHILRALR